MAKHVIVTGANGFVGGHLIRELSNNGYEVTGIGGPLGGNSLDLDHYITADLTNASQVKNINFSQVDAVIHLAALAAVGPSFDAPMQYMNGNVGMQVNLFEVARKQGVAPRFLIVSSGALYSSKSKLPITESSPVAPNSPYAISKLAQEQFANYYGNQGFECIVARPFNHIGPGQNTGFIVPDLTKQVMEAKKGLARTISVGNLESERDYTDVRDIVRAYRLLIECGKPGETYNICSNKSISGQQILNKILATATSDVKVIKDPTRMRPADTPVIYGTHDKLTKHTGWNAAIKLDQTIVDVVNDWQLRV